MLRLELTVPDLNSTVSLKQNMAFSIEGHGLSLQKEKFSYLIGNYLHSVHYTNALLLLIQQSSTEKVYPM